MKKSVLRTLFFVLFVASVNYLTLSDLIIRATPLSVMGTKLSFYKARMDSDIFLPFVSSSNELQFGEIALGSVNVISEIDTYIFNGTIGDVIQLIVTRTSGSIQPEFEVYRPDGTEICGASTVDNMARVDCVLDHTGTFTLLVNDRNFDDLGSYEVYTQRLNNPSGTTVINYGQVKSNATIHVGERDTYNFIGNNGDVIQLIMTRTGGSIQSEFEVYRPDGTKICGASTVNNVASVICSLDASGVFVILANDRNFDNLGSYKLELSLN